MPFTISHAAAILPFHKKPFVLSALIFGSFSPDFSYFLPFGPNGNYTHTISGLFLFCLPVSLLFLLVFHYFVKHPLISLFPRELQINLKSIPDIRFYPISDFILILVSILTGAFTHLIWDSFTHETGPAVLYFHFLSQPVFIFAGETIPIYKLLQYLSSALGGLALLIYISRKVSQTNTRGLLISYFKDRGHQWVLFAIVISSVTGLLYGWRWYNAMGFKSFVVKSVIGTMSSLVVFLLIYSLIWNIRSYKNR